MKTIYVLMFFLLSAFILKAQCPSAGVDASVCCQTAQLASLGVNGYWSGPVGAIYTPSDTSPNATVWIPEYNSLSYTTNFTWNETGCTPAEQVTITFFHSVYAEAGQAQSVCGTTTQLTADTVGSWAIGAYWTCNTPGVIITNGPVGDPLPWSPTVDISNIPNLWSESYHEIWFYWIVQNGLGPTDRDSVLVTFYQIPEANAGLDSSTCGKIFEMQGQASITNYTGAWSLLSTPPPGSAVFSPVNQTNAQVTVTQYGYYNFIWKEMNAGNTTCFDRDTVKINFLPVPTPDAGLDFSVCGVYAHIHATPSVSGGQWSGPPGIAFYDGIGGNYNDSYRDSASSYFRYSSENDTVTMYWYEFNGLCYGYDSVNIYFGSIQPAIALVDPADSVVCGPTYTLLNAQQPAYGYGYWYDTLMNTEFSPSETSLNPIVTIDNFSYGYHLFRWVTVNDLCRDTSDAISVLFKTNIIKGIVQSSLVTDFSSFKAELLPELNIQNIPFSSNTLTSAGNYSLWAEPNQNYYLKIIATDPLLYPTIANTYYNNTYNWQDATLITTTGNCDTLSFNVPLVTMTPATGGTCRIYGLVRYDVSLAPVNNAMVYLRYQPNQDPARFAFTNQNGYYSVNNIATGNYKLFVDIPGLPQVTNHHIIVNPNDTVFANVNFIVDTTSISKDYGFGIYADTSSMIHVPVILSEGIEISVFPNPFTDKIHITGTLVKPESIYVELIDNSGKTIFISQEKTLTDGKFTLPLSINGLTDGMYFIKIDIGNNTYIKKINKN